MELSADLLPILQRNRGDPRLPAWEEAFLAGMVRHVETFLGAAKISPKHWDTIRRNPGTPEVADIAGFRFDRTPWREETLREDDLLAARVRAFQAGSLAPSGQSSRRAPEEAPRGAISSLPHAAHARAEVDANLP